MNINKHSRMWLTITRIFYKVLINKMNKNLLVLNQVRMENQIERN